MSIFYFCWRKLQIGEPGSSSTRRDEYFLFLLEETANRRTWKLVYPTWWVFFIFAGGNCKSANLEALPDVMSIFYFCSRKLQIGEPGSPSTRRDEYFLFLLEETVQIGEPGSPSTRRDEYFLFLLEETVQIGEPGSPSTRRDEYFLILLEETVQIGGREVSFLAETWIFVVVAVPILFFYFYGWFLSSLEEIKWT